jgi:hypothetical protein
MSTETEKESKVKKKVVEEKVQAPKKVYDENYIQKIQSKLAATNSDELKKVNKVIEDAQKIANNVKDFDAYFRPFQEKRTLLWNELAKYNSFEIPINVNAGQVNKPANFSSTVTVHYNDASKEQMQHIETLRGKSSDLDRQDRVYNSLSMNEMDKRGLKLPQNYQTLSTEAAQAKDDLLISRICIFCGVEEDVAKELAVICHSQSLDRILDSWEYRNRTGFPNSNTEPTQNTSQSGYQ